MVDTAGLVYCDESVMSALTIVVLMPHSYNRRVLGTCWRCFVGLVREMDWCVSFEFGHIVRWHVWIWTVLADREYNIAEALECFVAEWVHGKVDSATIIVPVEIDLDIFHPCGVYRDMVVIFESVN